LTEVLFDVVGRAKTERVNKKGNHETIFRVSLKSDNGKHRLTLTDNNPIILSTYPLGSEVPVTIGKSSQTTFSGKELEKAVEEDAEED